MGVVIVGAGFAGIATAYHLARRGVKGITVVEKEEAPGLHASGRNAGLLRQSAADAAVAAQLRAGARAARRILAPVPGAFRRTGSLLLGAGAPRLHAGPRACLREAGELVAGLRGTALFDPDDGVLDPHALLGALRDGARARGVRFLFGEEVVAVRGRGRVEAVATRTRTLPAPVLVNAAGAWAGAVGRLAGSRLDVEPRRRHLFRATLPGGGRAWPFVWDEEAGVYLRPEGNGFLLSPCDAEPHPPASPAVDPARREELARKVGARFGALGEWRLGPGWACLRTFAADGRFLVGPDPLVRGLFWVAGLGGHGVTAAWAVGRLAAEVLRGRRDPGPFDPARLSARPSTATGAAGGSPRGPRARTARRAR